MRDFKGQTVFMEAVRRGDEALIPVLLDYGAAVDAKDYKGNTALLHLIASVEHRSSNWMATGRENVLRILLERGADVHAENDRGESPSYLSARYWNKDATGRENDLRILLERVDVNAKMDKGESLLHLAARYSNKDATELLLKYGASDDLRDH